MIQSNCALTVAKRNARATPVVNNIRCQRRRSHHISPTASHRLIGPMAININRPCVAQVTLVQRSNATNASSGHTRISANGKAEDD